MIKKLDINLFPESTSEEEYNKNRANFISSWIKYVPSTREYRPGGFFSAGYWTGVDGHQESDPIGGEIEWNKMYPSGYNSWRNQQQSLNSLGEQNVIDKINELCKVVNKLSKE